MRVLFKVGGTIVSALATALFIALDITEVVSLFGYSLEWKWAMLASFCFFLGFICWWIGGLEFEKYRRENAKPKLVFKESREYLAHIPETGESRYHALQVWFVNIPKTPTDNSVAKDVTAKVTVYDRTNKKVLSFYGLWVLAVAFDFAGHKGAVNKIDNIPPNDEPCKLLVALKWEQDESAYAFARESFLDSQTGDGREKVMEISKGTHYVKVHIRGTRIEQPSFWFLLTNPGQGGNLSISAPIKKPNLDKEGFPTE